MNNNIRCFLVFIIALLFAVKSAAQNKKIVVAVDESYYPYMYSAENNAKGLYVQQIATIFSRLQIEVEFKALAWKRALQKGDKGAAAVGGIYKNTDREQVFDFSQPIFEENLVVFVRKGSAFPFNTLSDLKDHKVGLVYGWSYGSSIDKARKEDIFAVEESNNNAVNFKKLIRGRVDCIIVDRLAGAVLIEEMQLANKIEMLSVPASINQTYLVFSKSYNQKKLMNRFNNALASMQKDGSYKRLVRDFFKKNLPTLTHPDYRYLPAK